MILSDGDMRLAARDFFSPALLLEFIGLADSEARAAWGERVMKERGLRFTQRRQPGDPDAGALTIWTPAPGGFRYAVEAKAAQRTGYATWNEVHAVIVERLTAARHVALREAVENFQAHDAGYVPGPVPFATSEMWRAQFYEPWSSRSCALQLDAASALLSILPGANENPTLF
ncbi:hypothetical protein [Streptomyces violascens]|uniref:Uncharacterized protein n=1 Tax=Streptomyces violascens TaxID=67381 RepID=A0ABQ3QV91_9ACTN|nr:hypothetical protein [Streptomyces violascens]GGU26437.1 hypothetical protein GCM10010289_54680 [Streptomyces violascens]GHI41205.1 hypothetical protein Sviol_56130 [Streptomyces violascens]